MKNLTWAVVMCLCMTVGTIARAESKDFIVCGDNESRSNIPDYERWMGPIKRITWELPSKSDGYDIVITFDKFGRVTSNSKKYRKWKKKGNSDQFFTFTYSDDGLKTAMEFNDVTSDTHQLERRFFTEVTKLSDGLFQVQKTFEFPLEKEKRTETLVMKEYIVDDERTRQICIQVGRIVTKKNAISDIHTKHQNITIYSVFESHYPVIDVFSAKEYLSKLDSLLPSLDPEFYATPYGSKYIFHSNGFDYYWNGKLESRRDINGRLLLGDGEFTKEVEFHKVDNQGNWIEKRSEIYWKGRDQKEIRTEKRKIEYFE